MKQAWSRGKSNNGNSAASSSSVSSTAASHHHHHPNTDNGSFWKRYDIFAYNPTYEWTSYKTTVGSALSWLTILVVLFYIFLTLRDYIVRPPELFSQGDIDLLAIPPEEDLIFRLPKVGVRVAYVDANEEGMFDDDDDDDNVSSGQDVNNDTSTTTSTATTTTPSPPVLANNVNRTTALENENPYVRFSVRHVWYRNQERIRQTKLPLVDCVVSNIRSQCPDIYKNGDEEDDETDTIQDGAIQYPLQGIFFKQDYQYLEINVNKCLDDTDCAPLDEINSKMGNGTLRIRVQVSIEAEQFDVEKFHYGDPNGGIVLSNRSFDFVALPDLIVQNDLVMKARIVQKEQRYIGSPPMPETETNVLSFDRKEVTYRPRPTDGKRIMSFYIRLDDNVSLEEVAYWCPSILDLFGLWGAMASFAASLSFGVVALQYNKWRFHRHFAHVTKQKKTEARQQTLAAMEWIRNNSPNNNKTKDDSKKNDGDNEDGDGNNQVEDTAATDVGSNASADTTTPMKRKGDKKTIQRNMIYSNLQAQYDALMVEPDIRLFESHHFDNHGRVAMSAAELKHPSTAFGELRKLALMEHGRKRRAAEFLSLWYARHLAKRGFFQSKQERLDALFASNVNLDANDEENQQSNNSRPKLDQDAMGWNSTNTPTSNSTWSRLRRRYTQKSVTASSAREQSVDLKKGTTTAWRHRNSRSSSDSPSHSKQQASDDTKEPAAQVDVGGMNVEQQRAAEAISAMDLAV